MNGVFGSRMRLHPDETLVENNDTTIDADYICTDAMGERHPMELYHYYLDQNGKKGHITREEQHIAELKEYSCMRDTEKCKMRGKVKVVA